MPCNSRNPADPLPTADEKESHPKHLGMSVSVYRRRERLRRAAVRIANGWKVEAAMLSVGYKDKTHFNRLFRREYTCAPSEYRRE